MRKGLLILSSLFTLTVLGQKKDYSSFIPKNYDTLRAGIAKGDLNKDGIEDVALALYPLWENDSDWVEKAGNDSLPLRMLVVLFGTKNGYVQSATASNVIMCKDCGGIFGDPFAGVDIKNNVLEIYHYGGSNWRWSYTYKFRYQNKRFFLVGKTSISYWDVKQCEKLDDFAGTDYEDINFLTGQYERRRISEDCKLLENKKGRKKTTPLISLEKFELDN